jgi:hypothetical protein
MEKQGYTSKEVYRLFSEWLVGNRAGFAAKSTV